MVPPNLGDLMSSNGCKESLDTQTRTRLPSTARPCRVFHGKWIVALSLMPAGGQTVSGTAVPWLACLGAPACPPPGPAAMPQHPRHLGRPVAIASRTEAGLAETFAIRAATVASMWVRIARGGSVQA